MKNEIRERREIVLAFSFKQNFPKEIFFSNVELIMQLVSIDFSELYLFLAQSDHH